MKKTILTLAVTAIVAGTMLTGCQSQADKIKDAQANVQDAQNKVIEAKLNLDQALKDSIQKFRKESEDQIAANEKSIAEYKVKLAKSKQANRAQYEKRLAEMEQQNREMKRRLDDFREDGKENWVTFRNKFNHDMVQMGKSFHDFWTGNR